MFYVVSYDEITAASYYEFDTYFIEGDIVDRKVVSYVNSEGDAYVVSGIVFDHLAKEYGRNKTYINIFKYFGLKIINLF